jgi:hypothetical protein
MTDLRWTASLVEERMVEAADTLMVRDAKV